MILIFFKNHVSLPELLTYIACLKVTNLKSSKEFPTLKIREYLPFLEHFWATKTQHPVICPHPAFPHPSIQYCSTDRARHVNKPPAQKSTKSEVCKNLRVVFYCFRKQYKSNCTLVICTFIFWPSEGAERTQEDQLFYLEKLLVLFCPITQIFESLYILILCKVPNSFFQIWKGA